MEPLYEQTLRYAGIQDPASPAAQAYLKKIQDWEPFWKAHVRPAGIWKVFSLFKQEQDFLLEGTDCRLSGELADKMLRGCERVAVLACTLGHGFDRFLDGMQKQDMEQALLLDAWGSALLEEQADLLQEQIEERLAPLYGTDRFSCGYEDLPLELQKPLLELLDARRLGIELQPSWMLRPCKSVTALIGFGPLPHPAWIGGCSRCLLQRECSFRSRSGPCRRPVR